jgi:putative hydrolase of the HAD superfamily
VAIEAVIFDFGGVIVPGSPAATDPNSVLSRLEREFGLEGGFLWNAFYLKNEGWLRLRVGEGSEEEWRRRCVEAVTAVRDAATAETVVERVWATRPQGGHLSGDVKPEFNAGMLGLLARLRGRYRVQLLSNAAPGLEEQLHNHYRIAHLFDDIINSATVRLAKPDPRIYHLAAGRLGLPPTSCFFTDDLAHNVESARAVGFTGHVFDGYEGLSAALNAAGVEH